jgi:hypothetical protein
MFVQKVNGVISRIENRACMQWNYGRNIKSMRKLILLAFILLSVTSSGLFGLDKIAFWNTAPRQGANFMNEVPTHDWFKAAAAIQIKWARLAYDKWTSDKRDYLIGDASDYKGLVQKDLNTLKEVLSWADKEGVKVVLTPLSLPGCRWRQNNNDRYDFRLWEDYRYQDMAIQFWVDLARELKSYDCIVAYDILNEPYPEYGTNIKEQAEIGDAQRFSDWYAQYKNTPRDIYDFYTRIIREIRKVDDNTPIMVESGFYAQPSAYCGWPNKLDDAKTLYSVHMYEPYSFTAGSNFRAGGVYSYPGAIEFGGNSVQWNKNTIIRYFEPFENWTKGKGIAQNRIVISEFGCMRRNKGVAAYLEDMLSFIDAKPYHWAFYAFREDGYDGYDYELGTVALPWAYWQALEQGESPVLPRKDNPVFDTIKKRLQK